MVGRDLQVRRAATAPASAARRMSAPAAMSLAPTSPTGSVPALAGSKRQWATVPGTSGKSVSLSGSFGSVTSGSS